MKYYKTMACVITVLFFQSYAYAQDDSYRQLEVSRLQNEVSGLQNEVGSLQNEVSSLQQKVRQMRDEQDTQPIPMGVYISPKDRETRARIQGMMYPVQPPQATGGNSPADYGSPEWCQRIAAERDAENKAYEKQWRERIMNAPDLRGAR